VSTRRIDVLLVCDPGGHFAELAQLRAVWGDATRVWVVPGAEASAELLRDEGVIMARGPTRRSLRALIANSRLAWRVLRDLRPLVILSTGAGLAVPFAWLGRLHGARFVYIECSGRVGISLTGRLIAPIATQFYVQWPEAATRVRGARYAGSVSFPAS
jgi:beta-1,4-N-acetylglucosaminyltransferase